MNKENIMSTAGSAARLRRSAVVERIRLREEWSALKETGLQQASKNANILTKKQVNVKAACVAANNVINSNRHNKESTRNMHLTNDTLRGVVALVEVGSECRALPLRAALTALGASVLPSWNPLVTHLVWSQGGCRATRARARALASRLVSPLWVEACAAASARLPERAFPAAARASDLPSPRTLRRLLKKAEMENIPITDLLNSSNEDNPKQPRLRISSDTERDTTDTTRDTNDTTHDTTHDTTKDSTTDADSRVNTAPRRALPKASEESAPPSKSRRKLFTHKELDVTKDSDSSDESTTTTKPRKPSLIKKPATVRQKPKLTQKNRRELARAERMAKKLVAICTPAVATQNNTQHGIRPRIVLTGMSRSERRTVSEAVKSLNGRLQAAVDRRTTHVLLGSCTREEDHDRTGLTGVTNLSPSAPHKPRTLNALCGAARGCRVLHAQWALHCKEKNKWLHHTGYEVLHLKKISQKARFERSALGKQRSEYAYDVFNGMRVRLAPDAEQCSAAALLLQLCGATVLPDRGLRDNDGVQNGGLTQNGGRTQHAVTQNGVGQSTQCLQGEYDIKIGKQNGEISSKWVFDSVAAGRMRTTRRYVVNTLSESDLVTQMERFQC